MANVDRPNGFRPVKTVSGGPWTGYVQRVGVADSADIWVGDAITLSSGLAAEAATGNEIAGVAIGFGRNVGGTMGAGGDGLPLNFDPSNLENRYYDDSASTHTEWFCWYVPATDIVFAAQTASAMTLVVGEAVDILPTNGSTTTGISAHEITTDSSSDLMVYELPSIPNNDLTLTNAEYWVVFINPIHGTLG